jgi:hypothetical protein
VVRRRFPRNPPGARYPLARYHCTVAAAGRQIGSSNNANGYLNPPCIGGFLLSSTPQSPYGN